MLCDKTQDVTVDCEHCTLQWSKMQSSMQYDSLQHCSAEALSPAD
jgi:hypothetical protein